MSYHQITAAERYTLALLRRQGCTPATIARVLGRHRSTIGRELRRNAKRYDGYYRADVAHWYATGRRARSRRNRRFGPDAWDLVRARLAEQWSPEQIAGRLAAEGRLSISHETIYRYIWEDCERGGALYTQLRGARKQRRKRYGRYDSRGRLAGKRAITERPATAEHRTRVGHLEGDTVMGGADQHCVLTLVDRKSGYTMIGKLAERTSDATNRRTVMLLRTARRRTHTITVDNGTEFHGYKTIEAQTAARFYFATPHHSWERGTNENTNGLIRQYLPKGQSMRALTQHACNTIARHLNRRPRKRLGYRTPEECYAR
jgi:IS30 family transposase